MTDATPPADSTRRINLVWVGLMALTVLSWGLASADGLSTSRANTPLSVAVVVIAGIKAAGITFEFMEVRLNLLKLRVIIELWIGAVIALIVALYLY